MFFMVYFCKSGLTGLDFNIKVYAHREEIMNIHLLLNGDNYSLDIVKLAILYFDKVIINIPSYVSSIQINRDEHSIFLDTTPYFFPFEEQLKSFVQNGLVELNYTILLNKGRGKNAKELLRLLSEFNLITELKFENSDDRVRYSSESKILSNEINETISNMSFLEIEKFLEEYGIKSLDNERNVILAMLIYEVLFSSFVQSIANNTVTVTNSEIVTQIIQNKNVPDQEKNAKQAAYMEMCSILLPNISQLNIEDILDIKYHSREMLTELRYYIESLITTENIYDKNTCNKIICEKINPTIHSFQAQIENLKLSTKQKIVENILSYKSLIPLLISAVTDIPSLLSGLVTAGLIAEDILLEYKKQKNSIIQDKNMALLFKLSDSNLL